MTHESIVNRELTLICTNFGYVDEGVACGVGGQHPVVEVQPTRHAVQHLPGEAARRRRRAERCAA